MIYRITSEENDYYETILKESMDDLNKFYEINWVHHIPKIIVVPDRKTIDLLQAEKTEPWQIGWAEGRSVYVLDKDNLEKESNHKYTPETYKALIKHEISHSFYNILSGHNYKPVWLCEGVAIYTSGQNSEKTKPSMFETFLSFYEKGGSGVYAESGFVVQMLVDKFGKNKMLELIKGLKMVRSSEEFDKLFKAIYGFVSSYVAINDLYNIK